MKKSLSQHPAPVQAQIMQLAFGEASFIQTDVLRLALDAGAPEKKKRGREGRGGVKDVILCLREPGEYTKIKLTVW